VCWRIVRLYLLALLRGSTGGIPRRHGYTFGRTAFGSAACPAISYASREKHSSKGGGARRGRRCSKTVGLLLPTKTRKTRRWMRSGGWTWSLRVRGSLWLCTTAVAVVESRDGTWDGWGFVGWLLADSGLKACGERRASRDINGSPFLGVL